MFGKSTCFQKEVRTISEESPHQPITKPKSCACSLKILVSFGIIILTMATSKITYNGGLRTTSIHERSGMEIITDAPVDNKGKGECKCIYLGD